MCSTQSIRHLTESLLAATCKTAKTTLLFTSIAVYIYCLDNFEEGLTICGSPKCILTVYVTGVFDTFPQVVLASLVSRIDGVPAREAERSYDQYRVVR